MGKKTDQRTRLTLYMIRGALIKLMQEKPVQGISVKALCDEAGISRGTFYSHYEDIYDLLHRIEAEMMEEFRQALAPLLQNKDQNFTVMEVTSQIFRCIRDNADLCSVTLGPYGDKEFAAELLAAGRESCVESYGKFFGNASPQEIEYYYAFVSAGCIGLLEKWIAGGMMTDTDTLARMTEGIMMQGIQYLNKKQN